MNKVIFALIAAFLVISTALAAVFLLEGSFEPKTTQTSSVFRFEQIEQSLIEPVNTVEISDIPSEVIDTTPRIIIDEDILPAEEGYADYNNDGVLDLVRKEIDCLKYLYINKGTNEKPVYEEGVRIE